MCAQIADASQGQGLPSIASAEIKARLVFLAKDEGGKLYAIDHRVSKPIGLALDAMVKHFKDQFAYLLQIPRA